MAEAYFPNGLPQPRANPDGLDAPYWDALESDKLIVQRCSNCQTWQWGPEWICHQCHTLDVGWEEVAPRGRIYSWERNWYPNHPALAEAVPFVVVLVELEHAGNIRMLGNLVGDAEREIEIGAEVEAVFEHHEEGDPAYTLVQWKRVE